MTSQRFLAKLAYAPAWLSHSSFLWCEWVT